MKSAAGFSLLLFVFTSLLTTCTKESAVSPTNTGTGSNGAGGSLARFTIVDNYLYLVDNNNLNAYDCTNPANPVLRSTNPVGFGIETIYPYKNKLFIGSTNGMYVYSLSDPAKPVKEGSVTHVRACDPVISNDSAAYVTLRSFGTSCGSTQNVLNIYDIKQLQQPKLLKTITMTSPYGLGQYQNALYVCDGENGLSIFDISKVYEPLLTSTIKGETFFDVIPYNDILICYIKKGLAFFDIKDPLKPVSKGFVKN